jgi:bifunctional DNA-binding transcriptional regulator/antitoxin component of YhaV-PrlF toxin-antitoxin module
VTVTVNDRQELVIPRSVSRRAGIRSGDKIEFKVSRRKITIVAKVDDEYTPAQRRSIDAKLAKARKGPHHGPFATAEEAIAFLRTEVKARKRPKKV